MKETSKNIYSLPIELSAVTLVVRDSPAHFGEHEGAVDFAVPIGTDVLAACDGVVREP